MKHKELCVVFSVDNNYIIYWLAMLKSLLLNNMNAFLDVHLIYDNIEQEKILKVRNFFQNIYKKYITFHFYKINIAILKDFKISHHINESTYYRFLIPDILPKDIDRVLYLDADTIVNGDISPIFDLEFDENTYLYACDHLFKPEQKMHLRKFGLSEFDDYFNAGVMYIDLKKWRRDNVSKVLMDFALKRKDDILWWDQDVLNVIFHKKWKKLHPKYNVIWEVLEANDKNPEIKEAKENPVIIHYTRSVKPWHSNSYHPLKHLYWKYRNILPKEILEEFK